MVRPIIQHARICSDTIRGCADGEPGHNSVDTTERPRGGCIVRASVSRRPVAEQVAEPYRQLAVYIPPPRTITTLIHDGVITDEQALQWYKATGMTDETAAAYVASAHVSKTSANRDLTVSQLIQLYEAQIIPRDKVVESIQNLGYDAQESEYIVELADVRFSLRAINAAVSKIQTLYVGHKIS